MPKSRSFRQIIEQGINRLDFLEKVEEASAPKRARRSIYEQARTIFSNRDERVKVLKSARNLKKIRITYKKITTGEVKKYLVAPYSWRYRNTREGLRKMLFAYDDKDGHIKGFVWRNVKKVSATEKSFSPKWKVEIG